MAKLEGLFCVGQALRQVLRLGCLERLAGYLREEDCFATGRVCVARLGTVYPIQLER